MSALTTDDAQAVEMITANALHVQEFIAGMTGQEFYGDANVKTQYAVCYGLTLIGENAKELSREFRMSIPSIPWNEIIGMRNWLAHNHGNLNLHIIYQTARTNVPEIGTALSQRLQGDSRSAFLNSKPIIKTEQT